MDEAHKKLHAKCYEVIDELNLLNTTVWKRTGSKELRIKVKRIIAHVNEMQKSLKK